MTPGRPVGDEAWSVRVPGDKSISHRALLFAALASGESRLRGLLDGADPASTASALRALGVAVPALAEAEVRIRGGGLHGLRPCDAPIDCGNSGTTARLLLGVLAGQAFPATLTGDASLRRRPMRRVTEPLGRMGASVEELGAPDRLPVRMTGGALRPLHHTSARASAQVKSALLLAGLTGGVAVSVREPALSRDHTERLLRAMGAPVAVGVERGLPFAEITPTQQLEPLDLDVPGDFSSAAYFIALGLLAREPLRINGVGLNPTRTGLLAVLERMGARVEVESATHAGEPAGDVVVYPAPLTATDVDGGEIPALIDEVPALAVLAARAQGTTHIRGAGELRVKESDRLAALAGNLRALGVDAHDEGDELVVVGTDAPVRGTVRCHGDHRIAMAFGVLAALPGNDIRIDDADVVSISFPRFWAELQQAAHRVNP
ncbi:MAG TPA: 3-phosphoshikimate 1-carboxyvinyltransferase [Longimicrobiales bacterium]|nr:3-phosphoshikimate 1-carboxyvinyltransferase [Longimicrobiales bacterium]